MPSRIVLAALAGESFWAMWWLHALVVLLVAGAAIAYCVLKTRSIAARNRELQSQLAIRTRELADLNEMAADQVARLAALQETSKAVASTLELDRLLDLIVQQATTLLRADAGIINLVDWDKRADQIVAVTGLAAPVVGDGSSLDDSLSGWATLRNQPLISNQVPNDDRVAPSARSWVIKERIQSAVVAPMKAKDQVMGTLIAIGREGGKGEFVQADLDMLVAFANQAAIAIHNARLYEQGRRLAIMEERSRLARDLHDSVTQLLYSSTLLAEAGLRLARTGDQKRAQEFMVRLGEVTQQALKEMRLMVYQLRPLALEEAGLVGALQQRLDAVEQRSGVDARLVVEGEVALPAKAEEELYRIAQEALNNALKHASPTMVTVTIRADGAHVELEIADNGKGFDLQAVSSETGIGLSSMRERASKLGATLAIVSAPGQGTRVKVTLKMPEKPE